MRQALNVCDWMHSTPPLYPLMETEPRGKFPEQTRRVLWQLFQFLLAGQTLVGSSEASYKEISTISLLAEASKASNFEPGLVCRTSRFVLVCGLCPRIRPPHAAAALPDA